VRELVRATERLREAYGGGGDIRAATRAERDAVRRLDDAAAAVLAEVGRKPSAAVLNRVRDTLRAAAADPEARTLLERGTLTRELEPAGFDAFAGLTPPAAPRSEQPSRAELQKLRRRVRTLEAQARKRGQAALVAERAAERAEAAAEKARRKAADARAGAAAADAALSEARAELESGSA
jgi:hypothetical protein